VSAIASGPDPLPTRSGGPLPRTRLVWHLFAGWCGLLAVVLVVCFWQASVQMARLADESQLRLMLDAARSLSARLPKAGAGAGAITAEDAAELADSVGRSSGVTVELLDLDGRRLPGSAEEAASVPDESTSSLLQTARSGGIATESRYDASSGRRMLAVAVPSAVEGRPAGIVRVTADSREADRALWRTQRTMLFGFGLMAVAAAWGGYLVAKRSSRGVEELADAAARLASGAFDTQVPTAELAEVSDLAGALGILREQLVERGRTIGRQGTQQEAVLGSMVEGVLAVDGRQRVVSINRAAAALLGLEQATTIGHPLQELVRNPELRRFALRAIDCQEPIEDDLLLRGPTGDRTILVRGTALREPRGGEGGAVIVLNDVTHFRHLENVRRDFVANVSHELKTPIASIKGFVETLLDGAVDDGKDARRFLAIVSKQADRLEQIIDDLLSLSRIEQSEGAGNLPLEIGPVADVLAAAVADCHPRAVDRDITLECACDPSLIAPLNRPLLEQAVINLVDNAIKYSESGRMVRVTGRLEQAVMEDDRPGVVISVTDQGCGIAPEHLPRIFERFYRVDKARSRKLGGTGLGLSIVKHIVQAHGGTVAVDSTPGVGTTFRLLLPLAEPE
jgi:two-component system phosphate regulon sensor histidine kinase PhoR